MIETSARPLKTGPCPYLTARRVAVRVLNPIPEIMQKACQQLQRRHHLAAVPFAAPSGEPGLLVLSSRPLNPLSLTGQDWTCNLADVGELRLEFADPAQRAMMTQLVERALLILANGCDELWWLDSPRIFEEKTPFERRNGIAAYRRYRLGVEAVEGTGLVINVEPATMFLTEQTVADFFAPDLDAAEAAARRQRFDQLSLRQVGQKGTLVYNSGRGFRKAYFDSYPPHYTCGDMPPLVVEGERYDSLYTYYARRSPDLGIRPEDRVAMVSFYGLKHPVPVAAKLLRLRVATDSLPPGLNRLDKLSPTERVQAEERFWHLVGTHRLAPGVPEVGRRWQPHAKQYEILRPPALAFGGNTILAAPPVADLQAYSHYYTQRLDLLNRHGCYVVPGDLDQTLYVAAPSGLPEKLARKLAMDVTDQINPWVGRRVSPQLVQYTNVANAVTQLKGKARRGTVLFVLKDQEPVDYYDVARELSGWRVKRALSSTVFEKEHDGWKPFVSLTALDVLQQMDCVPWSLATALNYDGHLAIDVGRDGRHFSLSLLLAQVGRPFRFRTETYIKADPNKETIHPIVLRDEMVKLFKRVTQGLSVPLNSLLVIRDGRECGLELEGIEEARGELSGMDILSSGATADVVDYRKHTASSIWVWDVLDGQHRHAPEGIALYLDAQTAILVTTGAPTIRQGTASPLLLSAHGQVDMSKVVHDLSALTYLNWNNTRTVQRHPPHLKAADEALLQRSQQEIRRHK
ncbi:MAG: hypothetical protein SFU83_02900 [Meiothermus sp.]|nr:hypothetical protein [Meiothermus sp.]